MKDFGMGKASMEGNVKEEVSMLLGVISDNEGKALRLDKHLVQAASNVISNVIFGSRYICCTLSSPS
jgi:hypothetical protein